jgi:hypothetical protein
MKRLKWEVSIGNARMWEDEECDGDSLGENYEGMKWGGDPSNSVEKNNAVLGIQIKTSEVCNCFVHSVLGLQWTIGPNVFT